MGGGRGEAGMIILLVPGILGEIGMEEVIKTMPGIVCLRWRRDFNPAARVVMEIRCGNSASGGPGRAGRGLE